MNYLTEALAWIADPANQSGPNGIVTRLAEHLLYTMIATGGAALVAIPLGYAIGHTGRGRGLVVGATGAARALLDQRQLDALAESPHEVVLYGRISGTTVVRRVP